jgi:peptidoglycan/xylan/chitin deacetylase (PgdA/CDA1 family)
MYYLTISWDDGFARSMLKVAEIYEKFGLQAEINVMAAAHLKDSQLPPKMATDGVWGAPYGDFVLWNELQSRGHVIQPHGLDHTNKAVVSLEMAMEKIKRCLDIFGEELEGFDPCQTVFNFPYNASSAELEAWLPNEVRAFRTGPGPALNPLPKPDTVKITTSGWADAEPWLEACVAELLAAPEGWLVYNAHGLDGEGWGPMRSDFLERILDRLMKRGDVQILPALKVLDAGKDG